MTARDREACSAGLLCCAPARGVDLARYSSTRSFSPPSAEGWNEGLGRGPRLQSQKEVHSDRDGCHGPWDAALPTGAAVALRGHGSVLGIYPQRSRSLAFGGRRPPDSRYGRARWASCCPPVPPRSVEPQPGDSTECTGRRLMLECAGLAERRGGIARIWWGLPIRTSSRFLQFSRRFRRRLWVRSPSAPQGFSACARASSWAAVRAVGGKGGRLGPPCAVCSACPWNEMAAAPRLSRRWLASVHLQACKLASAACGAMARWTALDAKRVRSSAAGESAMQMPHS